MGNHIVSHSQTSPSARKEGNVTNQLKHQSEIASCLLTERYKSAMKPSSDFQGI